MLYAQGRVRILRTVFLICFTVIVLSSIGAILFDGATFDMDRTHGLFGWLSGDETFTNLFILGFLCTICSNAGYFIAMIYLSPSVVYQAMMLEPLLALGFGVLFNLDDTPAPPTIFGLIAMLVANVLVLKGMHTMFKNKKRLVKEAQEPGIKQDISLIHQELGRMQGDLAVKQTAADDLKGTKRKNS